MSWMSAQPTCACLQCRVCERERKKEIERGRERGADPRGGGCQRARAPEAKLRPRAPAETKDTFGQGPQSKGVYRCRTEPAPRASATEKLLQQRHLFNRGICSGSAVKRARHRCRGTSLIRKRPFPRTIIGPRHRPIVGSCEEAVS